GVLGPEMMQDFRRQAERFGAEFLTDDVTRVDFSERPFRIYIGDEEYLAETVIVATGANARQLGLESEIALQGRGVSYCAVGEGRVTGVRVRDLHTDDTREIPAQGVFVAIGHDPSTSLFLDQLDHDPAGYLVTKPGSTATNVEGVFAAGDVQDHVYRQAVTAAGSGTMAALDAER